MTHLIPLSTTNGYIPWVGEDVFRCGSSVRFLGIIRIANHSVAMRIPGHGLVLWNPVAPQRRTIDSLRQLEETRGERLATIIGALDWHTFYLYRWQEAFPDAKLYLVSARPQHKRPELRATILDPDKPEIPGLESALTLVPVDGCLQPKAERSAPWKGGRRHELTVYHRPSRTLLVGDMFFSSPRPSLTQRLLGWRQGLTYNRMGFRIDDREKAKAYLERIAALGADRLITCHGDGFLLGSDEIAREIFRAVPRSLGMGHPGMPEDRRPRLAPKDASETS